MEIRLSTLLAFATLLVSPAPVFAGGLIDRFGAPVWEVGGTQANANFGFNATTAGDVDGDGFSDVIVGAGTEDSTFVDEGAAYLYRGSVDGSALVPSWIYRGRQNTAFAGSAVAPAGDVNNDGYADVLVGVPGWDSQTQADAGRVVVFHGGPTGLSLTPAYELVSPTPAVGQQFGITVAPAGDVNGDGYADVLVGSRYAEGMSIRGAVYLFEGGVAGLFTTPAKTWIGLAGGSANLGASLSTAGDVNADGFADVIIGSPGEVNPFAGGGSAYVYLGSPTGIAAVPDTVIKGTLNNANCGRSVSVAGDVNGDGYSDVLIGVPGQNTSIGKAMIGFGGPQGIATVTDLTNPEALLLEFTGSIVSTFGDINGDGFADFGVVSRHSSGTGRGRVSVYLGARTGPQYFGEILTHGSDGFFGSCLATTGDTNGDGFSEILVGTEETSVQPGQMEGVVYQFRAPKNGLRLASGGWPRPGGSPGTGYGSAVAIVSQFDGTTEEGKLVIGDPQFGVGGRVSLHSGSPTDGVTFAEFQSYLAGGSFSSYGAKIVDAGDTDGDGWCDFAVSKTTADFGLVSQAGLVELNRGALGALPQPDNIAWGTSDFDRVGSALAGRGDVNGDGFHDLLIGAREWDEPGRADCGKVYLFFGGPNGLVATPPWTRVGTVAEQGLGAGVALADYDGDGYTDVIVGSSSPTFGSTASGKVEVFYGNASGPANTPGVVYLPPVPEVSFGLTVAALGDVTADGIADLGIGAPRENNRGVVRIYEGTLGRSQAPFAFRTIVGTQDDARFGEAMAGGGDVDGDGISDMVIGQPGWDGGQTDEGRFGLYYGAPLLSVVPATVIESNLVGAALGASVAPFRDINLDGFADVVVGAPGAAGRVYPFAGGGGFGKRLSIQPVDYGPGSHRAVHPARSRDPDQVAAGFIQHTAAQGRTRLGFEVEIKPNLQPFDGVPTNLTGPTAFESGPAGSQTSIFTTSFLAPELPGRTLHLRGRWTTPNPLFPRSRWVTPEAHASGDHDVWITGTSVGVPSSGSVVGPLWIDAVAPNPALGAGATRVSFTLPRAGSVALDVFDLRGARVRGLLEETHPAGRASMAWDGRDDDGRMAATGVYILVLRAGEEVARAKVIRLP